MGKDSEFLEAARTGNIQVVEKFLTAKARKSQHPLASLRRGPGANVQDASGYTALHHAALNGHKDVVSLLLRHEASVNVQDSKGSTPLHLASWAGHTFVVKTLIYQGPSVPYINHQNKGGETALHCAAQYGHMEIACLLLSQRADPTLPNLRAEMPLDLAAQFGRLSIAELLLRNPEHDLLQPYTEDAATTAVFPHTPLHLASRNGHLAIVHLLITHGHNVNLRTSQGSPLHEAAICGKVDVVRTLMEAGADPGVRNDLGHTVLDTISSINTPVTQEISGLIKSLRARLIDFEDDAASSILTSVTDLENPSRSPSISSSITPRFSFPSVQSLEHEEGRETPTEKSQELTPSPNIPILRNVRVESSSSRPSSAPTVSVCKRPDSPLSAMSSSPPLRSSGQRPLHAPPLTDLGCPYENVLIPTRIYPSALDGETHPASNIRTIERRRVASHPLPSKDSNSNRRSENCPPPPSVTGESGRLSDLDGRASVASHLSETPSEFSVYDIPPTPRPKGAQSSSDRSSVSTRSSSAHEILDDDAYEVPQPPRPVSNCLRPHKEQNADGSRPQPPPKPPRRSLCPPSPTLNSGDSVYEMMCFASSGNPNIKSEDSDPKKSPNAVSATSHRNKIGPPPSSRNRNRTRISSDSDSDSNRPRNKTNIAQKVYTNMNFKPIKSRRTSKSNSYENTIHAYENVHSRPPEFRRKSGGGNHSSNSSSAMQRHSSFTDSCALHGKTYQDPWQPISNKKSMPQRARSMQAKMMPATDGSSSEIDEDSDGGRRPKSLDFGLCDEDDLESDLHKRNSRDIETETEPEDSLNVELRSAGVGTPPSQELANNGNEGYERMCSGSPCSLSSTSVASLSDRSASTDNIEEVQSDIPFAGLYRGSRAPADWSPRGVNMALERPRSLTSPSGGSTGIKDKGFRRSFPLGIIPPADNAKHKKNNPMSNSADQILSKGVSEGGSGGPLLSPLDEAEEWARIQDIMASFGSGVARESVFMAELEQEFQQKLGMSLSPSQNKLLGHGEKISSETKSSPLEGDSDLPSGIGPFLKSLYLGQYEAIFLSQGFDDVNFLNGLIDKQDLQESGITELTHQDSILKAIESLPSVLPPNPSECRPPDSLTDWLTSIRLPQYEETFCKHGFGDMERVRKIWEVELSVVLEVTKLGHRKRMLATLGDRPIEPQLPSTLGRQDLSVELSKLNNDISQLKQKLFQELPNSTSRERRPPESATNTIRKGTTKRTAPPPPPPKAPRTFAPFDRDEKKPPPKKSPLNITDDISLRDPSQLVVGTPNARLSTWKHHPGKLIDHDIQYVAEYLGSTHVKELKGTESTMKSIHKLRRSTAEGAKVPLIILAVSCAGVRFIDAATQSVVCEHEIRNIHCACQDADDLCHFAYITIDVETKGHYCHVFRVQSKDLANEIVMTIGQAFEVAYQIACRKFDSSNQSDEQKLALGHSRSRSEHVRVSNHHSHLPNGSATLHSRSLSTSCQNYTGGICAPHTSREDLLSDSGNNLDEEEHSSSRKGTSSPSSSSTPSTSESSCLHQRPLKGSSDS